MKHLIVFLLSLMIAVPALAGAPKNGTYKSLADIRKILLQAVTESVLRRGV